MITYAQCPETPRDQFLPSRGYRNSRDTETVRTTNHAAPSQCREYATSVRCLYGRSSKFTMPIVIAIMSNPSCDPPQSVAVSSLTAGRRAQEAYETAPEGLRRRALRAEDALVKERLVHDVV